ncbi:hypothetical protein V1634_08875 [Plantactinospora veratri]|uniref:Alpha/beta hydrolase n=1 Tax=Plantactinospora veratri TaxID=1436122 RepID=A0ABU7SAH4_9ACTN
MPFGQVHGHSQVVRFADRTWRCPGRVRQCARLLTDQELPGCGTLPDAEIHLLDTGHFALETRVDEIAGHLREFLGRTQRQPMTAR